MIKVFSLDLYYATLNSWFGLHFFYSFFVVEENRQQQHLPINGCKLQQNRTEEKKKLKRLMTISFAWSGKD